nr:putative defense protein Hdd11 [Leptinotarsa decemlineata]
MLKLSIAVFFCTIAYSQAYSGGAPVDTCDDMTPKHPFEPKSSAFPYKISLSKKEVKAGETVDIVIGGKEFKGFLLQVRNGDKAVGQFQITGSDKFAKAIDCHGTSQSAATHKNAEAKNNFKLSWKAPKAAGKYTIYATVAENGASFWARKPTEIITVF